MDINEYINENNDIKNNDGRIAKYHEMYNSLSGLSNMDKHILKNIVPYLDSPMSSYKRILESIYNDNIVYYHFVDKDINNYANSNEVNKIITYENKYYDGLNKFMDYVDKIEDKYIFIDGSDYDDNIAIINELFCYVDLN